MVLIQLLLPTSLSTATESPSTMAALAETGRELAHRFNGLTAYVRSPAKGLWTAPDGHTEHDEVVMVEVVADAFDQRWWRNYAAILATRFRQDRIHVRALSVKTLDENG